MLFSIIVFIYFRFDFVFMVEKVYLFDSKKIEGGVCVGYLHEQFRRGRCVTFYTDEGRAVPGGNISYAVLRKEREDVKSSFVSGFNFPVSDGLGWFADCLHKEGNCYFAAKEFADKIAYSGEVFDRTDLGKLGENFKPWLYDN